MPKKYRVTLTEEQRATLRQLIASGTARARTQTHARILLKADEAAGGPAWTNAAITEALEVSEPTVCRIRKRFHTEGMEAALERKEQVQRKLPKLDGEGEAHLIALACSEPPEGRDRWSLRLLCERFVALGQVDGLSHETVRQVLKRGKSNRG